MAVSIEEVLKTAKLAKLNLSAGLSKEEADKAIFRLSEEMGEILHYMDILKELDTKGVEPMFSPLQEAAEPREDVASSGHNAESVLKNAPERHENFFVVPPVL